MYELSTVKPHIGEEVRFTSITWPVYCQGYYAAIAAAVKVMQLAIQRRRTREREKRRQRGALRTIPPAALAEGAPALPAPAVARPVNFAAIPRKNPAFYRPIDRLPVRRRRA